MRTHAIKGNYIHGSLGWSFCLLPLDLPRLALALLGRLGLRLWLVGEHHVRNVV